MTKACMPWLLITDIHIQSKFRCVAIMWLLGPIVQTLKDHFENKYCLLPVGYIRDAATTVNFSCLLDTDVETGLRQIFSIDFKHTDSLQKTNGETRGQGCRVNLKSQHLLSLQYFSILPSWIGMDIWMHKRQRGLCLHPSNIYMFERKQVLNDLVWL